MGLLLLGGGLSAQSAFTIWRGWRTRDWRKTEGRIVAEGWSRDTFTADKDVTIGPTVRYRYTVDGVHLEGTRISFARTVPVVSNWTRRIGGPYVDPQAGLHINDRVEVWYDPDDPLNAVLRPGVSAGYWALLAGGLVFLSLGLLLSPVAYFAFFGP